MNRLPLSSCLAAALWLAPGLMQAQTTPELREILDRLQKLEESNRALTDEVHSLRQELASAHAPAPAPAAPAVAAEHTDEQAGVEKARVEEMAQSKVESSEKLPIRITGMALFNTYLNGRYNGGVENTTIAPLTPGDATGGGTLRQSILGFEYNSPQSVLGAKITGSLNLDLFGGSSNSLDHLVRLRTASIAFNWENTSILFGQEKPIISPRDPNSFAQVGYSPLTDAGNLWLWQPQIRLEQRVRFSNNFGLRAQVGVVQTRELGSESNGYNSYVPPPASLTLAVEHPEPGVEGRFELWRQWGENTRIEIAPGFHYNASTVGRFDVPSHLFTVDWLIKPVKFVEWTGFFYNGQNIANLGALPQGFVFSQYYGTHPVPSIGGWTQLRFPVTERLAFDIYGGTQDDQNAELRLGYVGSNRAYAANVMYRLAPNVIVSAEAGQVRTFYLGPGLRLNNHYDLAVAYLF